MNNKGVIMEDIIEQQEDIMNEIEGLNVMLPYFLRQLQKEHPEAAHLIEEVMEEHNLN